MALVCYWPPKNPQPTAVYTFQASATLEIELKPNVYKTIRRPAEQFLTVLYMFSLYALCPGADCAKHFFYKAFFFLVSAELGDIHVS